MQKFPFILDELDDLGSRRFALLIDEAHSSQGGKTTAKMHIALSAAPGDDEDDEESVEDAVNKLIESRKMLANASYFAFTATPKTKPWSYSASVTRKAATYIFVRRRN